MAYQNLVSQFPYKSPVLRSLFDQLGENDAFLKSNGWQDSVKVVFYQASVPTGWTQDVSANDKFLRVVNNVGGNAGGLTGGTLAASGTLTLNHSHASLTADGNHSHSGITNHNHTMGSGAASNSFGANYPAGVGDVVVSSFSQTAGASSPHWTVDFASNPTDADGTNSDGAHAHTVPTALSDVQFAYADAIVGVKATSSGYTDFASFFNHNDRIRYEPFGATGGLYGNDVFNNNRVTPSGSVIPFLNSAAPTGWSKLTTQNDKALRIVSGAGGGTGGTLGTGQTVTLTHTHTANASGGHSHILGSHRHNIAGTGDGSNITSGLYYFIVVDGSSDLRPTNNDGTVQNALKGRTTKTGGGGASGTDANHTHTLTSALSSTVLAYVDVIQCQKLSTGAPYAFQDLTSTILYKKLVTKQKLDKFAQNDEFLRYHTMPSGSTVAHYQSTIPINWTLVSAQNDKVLRVVTGAGGGAGGSQGISQPFNLAHTHPISSYNHTHSYPSHTHVFDSNSQAAGSIVAGAYIRASYNFADRRVDIGGATGSFGLRIKNTSTAGSASTGAYAHTHGGTSASALSNVTFAYANVILCQKN